MQAWTYAGRPLARLEQVAVADLAQRVETGKTPVLLDVRTPQEWNQGRIAGARHLPFTEILANCCSLPTDEEIVVYCGTGYRSNMAGSFMKAHGYADVKSLAGGLTAWGRAGQATQANTEKQGGH